MFFRLSVLLTPFMTRCDAFLHVLCRLCCVSATGTGRYQRASTPESSNCSSLSSPRSTNSENCSTRGSGKTPTPSRLSTSCRRSAPSYHSTSHRCRYHTVPLTGTSITSQYLSQVPASYLSTSQRCQYHMMHVHRNNLTTISR